MKVLSTQDARALRAATWNGAVFLGLTELHGSVEGGKRADLVLLSGSPLEEIENVREIRAVIFSVATYKGLRRKFHAELAARHGSRFGPGSKGPGRRGLRQLQQRVQVHPIHI